MTAIERTAYPRFKRSLTAKDLSEVYTPTSAERFLALRSTKGSVAELGFLVLLKTYQRLGRFIPLSEVPAPIIEHIAKLIDPHLDVSDLFFWYGVRVLLQHGEVGKFARRDAAHLILDAKREGGVDGDHAKRLIDADPLFGTAHLAR